MRHTLALTYSRWERLIFRFTGRWPERVVRRRLDACDRDQDELARMEPEEALKYLVDLAGTGR